MIDYDSVTLQRLKDKSSPGRQTLPDRLRSWWKLRNPRISAGPGVVLKPGVDISICGPGRLSIGEGSLFHAGVWLLLTMPGPEVRIGRHVYVGRDTIIAAKQSLSIGDFTVIAPRCYFVDHEHGFAADQIILNQRSRLQGVSVGRDCYFGTGTVVLAGVTIGDGAIVGAGSVVTGDIPSGQIWAGNPARYIKDRT